MTGSAWDAEDLVQETLLKALGGLYHFGQVLQPRAYLFRIASNTWIDQCRADRAVAGLGVAAQVAAEESPEDAVEISDAMLAVVTTLPPQQRVVLLLIDAFAFQAKEAAAMPRMIEGGMKAILHRARQALRRARSSARHRRARPSRAAPVAGRGGVSRRVQLPRPGCIGGRVRCGGHQRHRRRLGGGA